MNKPYIMWTHYTDKSNGSRHKIYHKKNFTPILAEKKLIILLHLATWTKQTIHVSSTWSLHVASQIVANIVFRRNHIPCWQQLWWWMDKFCFWKIHTHHVVVVIVVGKTNLNRKWRWSCETQKFYFNKFYF